MLFEYCVKFVPLQTLHLNDNADKLATMFLADPDSFPLELVELVLFACLLAEEVAIILPMLDPEILFFEFL